MTSEGYIMKSTLLLCLGILCCPWTALAEQADLSPSAAVTVTDPLNRGNSVTLLRFDIPATIASSRIVRATLWQGTKCGDSSGVAAWVHPAPAAWEAGTTTWSWWLTELASLDEKEISHFETSDCEGGVAVFEVSRLVRAWATGDRPNFGVALRRPPNAAENFAFTSTAKCPAPYLTITYRLTREPTEQRQ
jgi:hypothetical protein